MAGSLPDAHCDADAVVEVHYQIIVNRTCCHASTASTSRVKSTPMWAFQKVSEFWQGKIHLHAWSSATLIPFEVVFLWLNTLLRAVPPLLEVFLECLFANGVQLGRRVPYNVVSWLKSSPFQLRFQLGEQPKIASFREKKNQVVYFGNRPRMYSSCVLMWMCVYKWSLLCTVCLGYTVTCV